MVHNAPCIEILVKQCISLRLITGCLGSKVFMEELDLNYESRSGKIKIGE
jgi:hypothetical protein